MWILYLQLEGKYFFRSHPGELNQLPWVTPVVLSLLVALRLYVLD